MCLATTRLVTAARYGETRGWREYLVVAYNGVTRRRRQLTCDDAFQAAPRNIEAVAVQLQEDARRSSCTFVRVLRSSVAALPLALAPKPPKLIEVCVPTPHLAAGLSRRLIGQRAIHTLIAQGRRYGV